MIPHVVLKNMFLFSKNALPETNSNYRVLKGGVSKRRGQPANPEDSGREDWGTLGKIRGITTTP